MDIQQEIFDIIQNVPDVCEDCGSCLCEDPYEVPWGSIDHGIKARLWIMVDSGFRTTGSCEGGPGHMYDSPTIVFEGTEFDAFRALQLVDDMGWEVVRFSRHMNYPFDPDSYDDYEIQFASDQDWKDPEYDGYQYLAYEVKRVDKPVVGDN